MIGPEETYHIAGAGIAIALVLGVLAGGIQAVGERKQAKEEQDALNANARVERRNAYARERAARRSGTLAVRRQQLLAQSGGIDLEGSPLEQLARNTNAVEIQALGIRAAGNQRADQLRWQGRAGVAAANRNLIIKPILGGLGAAAGQSASLLPARSATSAVAGPATRLPASNAPQANPGASLLA